MSTSAFLFADALLTSNSLHFLIAHEGIKKKKKTRLQGTLNTTCTFKTDECLTEIRIMNGFFRAPELFVLDNNK